MMNSIFVALPIVVILTISTYTDLKNRLIYNWVTIPGMIYFFLYHFMVHTSHLMSWILGFLVLGGVSLMIAMITNSLGGGDIKLFALLGLAYGLEIGLQIYFCTYLFAVLFSIPLMVRNKFLPAKRKVKSIPMAPFMALGTIIIYLFR